jgi:hypothetical protein
VLDVVALDDVVAVDDELELGVTVLDALLVDVEEGEVVPLPEPVPPLQPARESAMTAEASPTAAAG